MDKQDTVYLQNLKQRESKYKVPVLQSAKKRAWFLPRALSIVYFLTCSPC